MADFKRTAVLFVSYDGALDPLGGSQVVPYLEALVRRGLRVELLSFEKPEQLAQVDRRLQLSQRLARSDIGWQPQRYHKSPRVPATLWDVARGAVAITRQVSRFAPDIVQARGDIAMAMSRLARLPRAIRRVYEARGLFADERVEIGSWRSGGWLDRAIRRLERGNLAAADGLLCVMASAGLEGLRACGLPLPPFRQLPNSVDLAAFTPAAAPPPREFGVCYHGSLGGWYPTGEIVALARAASRYVPGRALFLTPHQAEALAAGATADWAEVVSAVPQEVPAWLRRVTASCFLIQPSPSKRASSPTKFAEALACGLPVLANGCSGDLDQLLEAEGVGTLVDGLDSGAYERAAVRFGALVAGPGTAPRCRALAERRYGVAAAAEAYHGLYDELLAASRPR